MPDRPDGAEDEFGTPLDTFLYGIHDPTGVLIANAAKDNGGTEQDCRLTFTAGETGTHYVAAGNSDFTLEGPLGIYTLSVEEGK